MEIEENLILTKNNNGYTNFFKKISPYTEEELVELMQELIYGFKSPQYAEACKKVCKDINNKNNFYYREIKNSRIENVYKYIYEHGFNSVDSCYDQRHNLLNIEDIIKNIYKKHNINFPNTSDFKKNYFLNYSICHIYDGTKNPYLFTMPWNYFLIPTPIAPITDRSSAYGKENNDSDSLLLKKIKKDICKTYKQEIELYNNTIIAIFNNLKKDSKFLEMIENLDSEDLDNIRTQFYTINLKTTETEPLI